MHQRKACMLGRGMTTYFTYSLRVMIGVWPAFGALVNSSNVQYVCKI